MRSLRNVMRTSCVVQTLSVMRAFGACWNASHHLSQRSGITYHLRANEIYVILKKGGRIYGRI